MKFGKKVLSVFLASLVAVSAGTLSACSGNPNSAGSNGTDSSEKSEQQTGIFLMPAWNNLSINFTQSLIKYKLKFRSEKKE